MQNKQTQRSEETKRSIIAAASALFADKGYDAVTMREIARKAGCSHTAIYLYFADKEALLHQISMSPLQSLKQQFRHIFSQQETPEDQLKELCITWIRFCLTNRNMYEVLFSANAVRVDEKEPRLELNRLRNELFDMLKQALQSCLPAETGDERLLSYARITFFMTHGIVGTYRYSHETVEELMDRLAPTFEDAFAALLIGFHQMIEGGESGK